MPSDRLILATLIGPLTMIFVGLALIALDLLT